MAVVLAPEQIVDRVPESDRFEALLNFATPKRVLTVSDDGGRGKTTLLQKLRWICEVRRQLPVALVPLDEYDDIPDEFALVRDIVKQLSELGVGFPAFTELANAFAFADVQRFRDTYRSVQGVVQAGGSTISGDAQVAGVINVFNVDRAENVATVSWNNRADEAARRICVDAFFGELASAARSNTIVLLFDGVDVATDDLQRWIFLQLVRRRVLADESHDQKLLVVLAGHGIDTKLQAWFEALYETHFDPIPALGDWELKDTVLFLQVHGYAGLPDRRIADLHESIIKRELSLAGALGVAGIYSAAVKTT